MHPSQQKGFYLHLLHCEVYFPCALTDQRHFLMMLNTQALEGGCAFHPGDI